MDQISDWWSTVPPVTKYLFAGSMGVTLAANFGLINPYYLLLDWDAIFKGFEFWRLPACFFFHGKLGFPFLIHMMFLIRYATSLEQTIFQDRTADYVWMLLFSSFFLLIAAYFLNLVILGMSLIMVIIYLWSRKNPNINMSFFFGLRFQSVYFPWVLIGFNILMGGFPLAEIVGVVVGHIYYYLEDIYPLASGGTRLLKTPAFMYNLFPPTAANRYNPNNNNNNNQGAQPGVYNWGQGRNLND